MTKQEFERYLKEEQEKNHIKKITLQNNFISSLNWQKEKAGLRIAALEAALVEIKLNKQKEFEKFSIALNDIESKLLNEEIVKLF